MIGGRSYAVGASRIYWRRALMLAFAGLLCALLLGGLSAWFLSAVALAGLSTATALVFNFHVPGGLVRLFAIGRTVARYGERLAGHKAALTDQVERRIELFRAMAAEPAVRGLSWQLGDPSQLADYLDDVEDLDFGRLRINLPITTLCFSGLGLVIATAIFAPLALLIIGALLLVSGLLGYSILKSGASLINARRHAQRKGAGMFGAAIAAVVSLRAEHRFGSEMIAGLNVLSDADRAMHSLRRNLAGLDALLASVGPLSALTVILAAWMLGATGEVLLIPVFVAFAWFAFAEALQGAGRIVLAHLKRNAAHEATALKQAVASEADTIAPAPQPASVRSGVEEISCNALQRIGPDGRPLGLIAAFRLRAGRPTILTGASGSGKTSLLKQIAGWIGDDVMPVSDSPASAAIRRDISMLCLHDAAILSDTIRANLFADADDASIHEAISAVEMTDRVKAAGGLDGWINQEQLSLGEAQRINLARAWLSDRPIILLDEPLEHLPAEQGARILGRLLVRLDDRIVVASSHRNIDAAEIASLNLDDRARSNP